MPEPSSSAWPMKAGVHDLELSDLSPQALAALESAALPWMTSLGFCTMYDDPPAQRIILDILGDGRIKRAAFYKERAWMGMLRIMEFVGFPELSESEVLQAIKSRKAHLAVVQRLEPPLHSERAGITKRPGRIEFTHDVIATLPRTKEDYLQSLGKQKRQQLPRYWRRLQREFNDQVTFTVQGGHAIRLDDILELVKFNQTRMETKGKENASIVESKKQARRWPLTQSEGLLCKVEANGKLLGGTFNYVHQDEAFLIVIAHDPHLERLNIGNLGLWKTIEHLIEIGIKRYHLFWGRKLYKTQFGGLDHPVVLQVISPHRWLVPLWAGHLQFWRQLPRALRFVRSRALRIFNRGPIRSKDDQSEPETGESTPASDRR